MTQLLVWLIASVVFGVALYFLHLCGGRAGRVRLFEILWRGVSAGFFFGMVAMSCADEFTGFVGQQKYWPHWYLKLLHAFSSQLDNAPVIGMVVGLGLAMADWWIRPKPDDNSAIDV